jgi:cytochrome c oxidase cbb3-type subunit III
MRSIAYIGLFACALSASAQQSQTHNSAGSEPQHRPQQTGKAQLMMIPLGDEVGAARNRVPEEANPQAANPGAVKAGQALFAAMNCAYCHGFKAKGVMGPSLTDGYWRYGGTPPMIFKSIAEGRPEGMPAWGAVLSDESIWDLVAYLTSLGGAYDKGSREAALDGDLAKGATKPGAGLLPMTQGSY